MLEVIFKDQMHSRLVIIIIAEIVAFTKAIIKDHASTRELAKDLRIMTWCLTTSFIASIQVNSGFIRVAIHFDLEAATVTKSKTRDLIAISLVSKTLALDFGEDFLAYRVG